MPEWNFVVNQPVNLTIAADASSSPINGNDDQVWELNLGNSEPPSISLQTTFGLRARSCKIFPRFVLNNQTISNPNEFYRPITIHHYYPNYVDLSFKPFQSINVRIEYWVPDPQTIACRTTLRNTTGNKYSARIEWAEVLIPAEDGDRMSAGEIDLATILVGQTSDLSPVLYLGGGAVLGKSPYPSLDLALLLIPHQVLEIQWVHATYNEPNKSFEHAKSILSKNWDTEFSRVYRKNAQRLEIFTGDQVWDTALYLSQTIADQLISVDNGSVSYVDSRRPDRGFYPLPNKTGSKFSKKGQTTLGTFYLANFLLPSAPGLFHSLIDNFIIDQSPQDEKEIALTPARDQDRSLDTPLLSSMVWAYYQISGDREYLAQLYPGLLSQFYLWFDEAHDRDQDTFPEWDQPAQTGFEENPLFSYLGDLSIGIDISKVESPDLLAYLFNECQALISIGREINHEESLQHLQDIVDVIRVLAQKSWDDVHASYFYRDRDSHAVTFSQVIGTRSGSGLIEVNQDFIQPVRPQIQLKTRSEGTKPVQIYIQGTLSRGVHRVEHIEPAHIHWQLNSGFVTSNYTYESIEQIEINGLTPDDEVVVRTAGAIGEDITMLLPLWSGIPTPEQAKVLINLTILNKKRFLSPFGIRSFIGIRQPEEFPENLSSVQVLWSYFVMKGLIRYGERNKAAEIFSRLTKAVVNSIKKDMTLHKYYRQDTGFPWGNQNSLSCLVPVGLFLEILGVKIYSPSRLEISGGNPFPWSVTIKYRGLTVVHQKDKSMIIFSDGQNLTIDNQTPKIINLNNVEVGGNSE
jgi:hypothetical protein